jgi:hypothetical protein
MPKIRAHETAEAAGHDGYDAMFVYAEQWLRLQDAAVGNMLASIEPLAATWWHDVNGAADGWTRLCLEGLESTLEQMRVVGDAVVRNQQRFLDEWQAR